MLIRSGSFFEKKGDLERRLKRRAEELTDEEVEQVIDLPLEQARIKLKEIWKKKRKAEKPKVDNWEILEIW